MSASTAGGGGGGGGGGSAGGGAQQTVTTDAVVQQAFTKFAHMVLQTRIGVPAGATDPKTPVEHDTWFNLSTPLHPFWHEPLIEYRRNPLQPLYIFTIMHTAASNDGRSQRPPPLVLDCWALALDKSQRSPVVPAAAYRQLTIVFRALMTKLNVSPVAQLRRALLATQPDTYKFTYKLYVGEVPDFAASALTFMLPFVFQPVETELGALCLSCHTSPDISQLQALQPRLQEHIVVENYRGPSSGFGQAAAGFGAPTQQQQQQQQQQQRVGSGMHGVPASVAAGFVGQLAGSPGALVASGAAYGHGAQPTHGHALTQPTPMQAPPALAHTAWSGGAMAVPQPHAVPVSAIVASSVPLSGSPMGVAGVSPGSESARRSAPQAIPGSSAGAQLFVQPARSLPAGGGTGMPPPSTVRSALHGGSAGAAAAAGSGGGVPVTRPARSSSVVVPSAFGTGLVASSVPLASSLDTEPVTARRAVPSHVLTDASFGSMQSSNGAASSAGTTPMNVPGAMAVPRPRSMSSYTPQGPDMAYHFAAASHTGALGVSPAFAGTVPSALSPPQMGVQGFTTMTPPFYGNAIVATAPVPVASTDVAERPVVALSSASPSKLMHELNEDRMQQAFSDRLTTNAADQQAAGGDALRTIRALPPLAPVRSDAQSSVDAAAPAVDAPVAAPGSVAAPPTGQPMSSGAAVILPAGDGAGLGSLVRHGSVPESDLAATLDHGAFAMDSSDSTSRSGLLLLLSERLRAAPADFPASAPVQALPSQSLDDVRALVGRVQQDCARVAQEDWFAQVESDATMASASRDDVPLQHLSQH